jgi:hypothetical protein
MRTRVTFLCALFAVIFALPSVPAPAQPPAQPAKPAGLDAVPTDSFAFLTVNAGKLWENPNFKPMRDWFAAQKTGPTEELFGLFPADLDRVTVCFPTMDRATFLLVTTKKPYNEAKLLKALAADKGDPRDPRPVKNTFRTANREFPFVVLVDDRTLLFLSDSHDDGMAMASLLGQLLAKKADGPLAAALADAGKHDIALGVDLRPFAALAEFAGNKNLSPYLALLKARTVTFAANFDKTARCSFKLAFADEADAKRAAPVLKEGITELIGYFEKEVAGDKDRLSPTDRLYSESAAAVLKVAKVEQEGKNVFAVADVPYQDAVAKFAVALPKSYSAAVGSAKGQNNLKQLALAMHNFDAAYGFFPGDVLPFGNMPQPWSWRVQILPFLEQDNLYRQLDTTKAWDDPANLKKLEAMPMPKVFEIPGRPAPKGYTYFRVFSLPKNAKGKERPWLVEGQKGPPIAAITDGTSNTLMIVEAGEAVPWYKPDVLAYDGKLPLPQLGDKTADRFLAAMGDGSVRILKPSKLGEKTLRALITIQGGEAVNLP